MDTSDQYLDCLCRTCLNEVEPSSYGTSTRAQQWQFIFDRIEECGALRIAELLSLAVPQMEMLQSDELPKKICCKCLQELLSAYRFQQMCVRSEEQMRAIVSTKESDIKISMEAASKERELVTNDTEAPYSSSTHENLAQPSIQEPLREITEQITEAKAVQSSSLENINKLLEACKDEDEEGRSNEFLKNEPPKDGGDRMHSTISVLSMEYEEARIHVERILPEAAQSSAADHLQSIDQLLEHCKDSQGELSEFIKSEHSKEDTRHSTISIERKEEQVNVSQDAIIEPEAAQPSAPNQLVSIDQLPEHCNDSQGEFSECIKNEPIEDDEPNIEYSDDDTIHSTISVTKEEVLAIECEEGQTNLITPRHHHEKENNGDISGKRDSTHSDTSSHLSITHSIAESNTEPILKQHACTSCDKTFKSAAALKRHVCTHTGEQVECEKASSLSRKGGNKRTHTSEKPHKCDICEKRFIRIEQLRGHHKRIHTGEKPYKCKYCELAYATKNGLKLHLHHHVYKCAFCTLVFSLASDLLSHLNTHENENPETRDRNMKALREEVAKQQLKDRMTRGENKPYECPYCPVTFSTISQVKNHKQIHEGVEEVACDICGKKIRKSSLRKHKLTHSKEKLHKCDFCGKRFTDIVGLRNHSREHTGEKPFKCKYCECAFTRPNLRTQHLRSHLGDNVYRCEFCPSAFPLASERRSHLLSHKNEDPETRERNIKALQEDEAKLRLQISKEKTQQPSTEESDEQLKVKPFKCKYCKCAFTRPNLRTQHLRSHLGDNVYRCEFCPSAFPLASERRSHLLSHKNEDPETRERNIKALQEDEAKLRLQISKEKTQQPSTEESAEESDEQLKEYITPSENKPYECPYCPLRFRSKRYVSQHKEIHEGVKLGACDICGKKVKRRCLKKHKLTHSEEKLHKCDLCEKRFKSTLRLRLHMRTHTGEKRLKCKYCESAYSSYNSLNKHLQTHLGDNVFRCEFCPLSFPSASERRLHLPSHKNEDPATRERNINALREDEAKLRLQIAKEKLRSCRQKTSS